MIPGIKLISLGELLWDCFPEERKLGGAPANVAFHAAQFGAEAQIVSAVGNDEPGRAAVAQLRCHGLDTSAIQTVPFPTGMVRVTVDRHGKPEYRIEEGVAWDHIGNTPGLDRLAESADAVCFGSLAQRHGESRAAIRHFLDRCRPDCLKVFDINLRLHYHTPEIIETSLHYARVLKLNDEELPLLAGMFGLNGDAAAQLRQLQQKFDLCAVALTRGARGAILVSGTDVSDFAGVPVTRLADTVGAGDSFTAVLIAGLAGGRNLTEINRRACMTAAYVCTQNGAMPVLPEEIRQW